MTPLPCFFPSPGCGDHQYPFPQCHKLRCCCSSLRHASLRRHLASRKNKANTKRKLLNISLHTSTLNLLPQRSQFASLDRVLSAPTNNILPHQRDQCAQETTTVAQKREADSEAHDCKMAHNYILQVTAGSEYDITKHQVVPVNESTPITIDSEHVSVDLNVRIQVRPPPSFSPCAFSPLYTHA